MWMLQRDVEAYSKLPTIVFAMCQTLFLFIIDYGIEELVVTRGKHHLYHFPSLSAYGAATFAASTSQPH